MKIGFTCSTFDLFHAGHVAMLKEAKRQCDYLIVGLQTDPTIDRPTEKNKPIQSVFERFVQIDACKYVDEIVVYSTEKELIDIFLSYPIDIRILGVEYQGRDFTGKTECLDRGIDFYFNDRKHSFSTTELRQRVYNIEKLRIDQIVAANDVVIDKLTQTLYNKQSLKDFDNEFEEHAWQKPSRTNT
jgi:glycerol-3-phosphate cytidylyltransferase